MSNPNNDDKKSSVIPKTDIDDATMANADEDGHEEEDGAKTDDDEGITLSTSLLRQCYRLLADLDAFLTLLRNTLRNPQAVEARQLRTRVASESHILESLHNRALDASGNGDENDAAESRLVHTLKSSNLPFYQAVWDVSKGSCTGIVAFGKRFYYSLDDEEHNNNKNRGGSLSSGNRTSNEKSKQKRKSVLVDIIADDGAEWVKVSTISETRLLFEMAEKGWEGHDDSPSSASVEENGNNNRTILRNYGGDFDDDDDDNKDEDDDELDLIRLAKGMKRASAAARVRYRHPRIRFVFSKIDSEKAAPEILDIFNDIRAHGITVQCRGDIRGPNCRQVAVSEMDLSHLLPHPFKGFTSSLNVDCTLLLAMVSDLSHATNIQPSPGTHKAVLRQIEVERQRPLLSTDLYPAIDARELVCTQEAATRMRDIVNVIGTDTEKRRTAILMGDHPDDDDDALRAKFQQLSDYPVPAHLKLPVKVVEAKPTIATVLKHGGLPSVANEFVRTLSDINQSVFLYGWAVGLTTISSNRTVGKQIETLIEEYRDGNDDLVGPSIWICEMARSLIGKDARRKP